MANKQFEKIGAYKSWLLGSVALQNVVNPDVASNGKKIALVLSGGMVKAGAWHLGVAKALEEIGFSFKHNHSPPNADFQSTISTYVGSSAGSLIGLYLASGLEPSKIEAINTKNAKDDIPPLSYRDIFRFRKKFKTPGSKAGYGPFAEFPSVLRLLLSPALRTSGFFSTRGVCNYVKEHVLLSDSFEDYEADVFIVATQLDHSRKAIFSKHSYPPPHHDSEGAAYYTGVSISDAIAASMSVPPFYAPWPVKNNHTGRTDYYIDGEIRETLSTHVAFDNNCDVVISSWTHTPYHYQEEIGSLVNYGLPAICTQAIFLMIQKKIVAARNAHRLSKDIVSSVSGYMRENKFSEQHRRNILKILEEKLNYRSNVELIDIFPRPDDHKVFFHNSFTLNPRKNLEIINLAYKRTMEVFASK